MSNLLSPNFHQTFVPERRLIASLLEYAALNKEGTIIEISKETGIPTGKSSGKLPAIYAYCKGMGLIADRKSSPKNVKSPVLTDFGKAVFLNDKHLGDNLTQWLVHINLSRPDIGAKVWHEVFAKSKFALGRSFTLSQLDEYLSGSIGKPGSHKGPLVSTYTDEAALGRAGILSRKNNTITRNAAPLTPLMGNAYAYLLIAFMEVFFLNQTQVTLTDFNRSTSLFDICAWQEEEIVKTLAIVEGKGHVTIDRQIRPWVIEARCGSARVLPHIFDDLA